MNHPTPTPQTSPTLLSPWLRRFLTRLFLVAFTLVAATSALADQTFVSTGAVWKYLDNGSNQGTAWRESAFDDSSWASGPSQLGYGDGDEATVVGYGGTATNKSLTTYFRHRFTVADPASFEAMILRLQRDDGAVVYLNGVEIVRSNMPAGTITSSTVAASTVDSANESAFFDFSVPATLLAAGENVVAVEIHQINATSSDISFNLELKGITKVPALTILPAGSSWRYLDSGVDPGVQWASPAYDDRGWSEGAAELGYGDGGEATIVSFGPSSTSKYITTYFRRVINVSDPATYKALKLRLLRDDGAIVYLNGVEIHRSNMPAGTVTPNTLASVAIGGTDESAFLETLLGNPLVAGPNVLAVEVHQSAASSTDLSFDLELLGLLEAPSANVTRGPYLQNATSTSMAIRWRTDITTSSSVWIGTDLSALDRQITDETLRTEHEINVTGLLPNQQYYYEVGSSSGAIASGSEYTFFTPPAPGTRQPIRVWVLGDSGTANPNAAAVRNAYTSFAGSEYTDLWLMLGDNAYDSGTDAEFQAAVFDMYPSMLRQSPLWSTLGNHEYRTSQAAPYFNAHTFPTQGEAGGVPSGTEKYYSFDYGNVHFICLDSMSSDRSANGPMAAWLQADLESTTQEWIVAFWHHPPYTFGSHNSDNVNGADLELVQMRETFLPILEAGGVDLVLGGHSHCYERSYLIDGHYGYSGSFTEFMKKDSGTGKEIGGIGAYLKPFGLSANQGAVYAVAGSSGKATNWWGGNMSLLNPTPHPTMVVSRLEMGSMILDVNGPRMDVRFLNSTGLFTDEFTIRKNVPNAPPTVSITSPTQGSIVTAPVRISATATPGPEAEGGSVSQVDFYDGDTLLGSSSVGSETGVFEIEWNSASAGTHTLKAVAWDQLGASAESAAVSVTVNSAPTVTITNPTPGQVFITPASIQISADASDLEGEIAKVVFRAGNTVIGEVSAVPFTVTWTDAPLGGHQLTAVAYDGNGASTASMPVAITVEEPNAVPTVALTSPTAGSHFDAPASITIRANATDSDGTITEVAFYQGSTLLNTDTAAPYEYSWTNVAAGTYEVIAVVKDNRRATASAATEIVVNAVQPPAAPGNFAATVISKSRVDLRWTDNSTNESGFELERSTINTFTKAVTRVSLAANTSSYSDITAKPNTQYYYRLRAVNGGGASGFVQTSAKTPR